MKHQTAQVVLIFLVNMTTLMTLLSKELDLQESEKKPRKVWDVKYVCGDIFDDASELSLEEAL